MLSAGGSDAGVLALAYTLSPARSASWAAARGGITLPLDVQNAEADTWSWMSSARSDSASCALPSYREKRLCGVLQDEGEGEILPCRL